MRLRLTILLATLATLTALAPAAAHATAVTGASQLTLGGLGSLRIGMTVARAKRRTGQRIEHRRFGPGSDCGTGQLRPRRLGVSLLTTNDRIAVIVLGNRRIATRAGIRVGDTVADLRAAYGSRLRSAPNKYDPDARDYAVRHGGHKLRFFVTGRHRIRQISTGRRPEIDYVEGCA